VALPAGLVESDRLPEPIFTPATKAEAGEHDENIDFETMASAVGHDVAERVRDLATALYQHAAAATERVGILLADTKFEFGLDEATGDIILIDEALTPDSSRFWDAATYEPGRAQASFDKQFVRDWLEAQPWDKTAPGPALPTDVVAGTRARYVEAYERITGASFARYLEEDVIAP
jgi:phosphoribosylaminoimidazole-succinocarboxamide synthase